MKYLLLAFLFIVIIDVNAQNLSLKLNLLPLIDNTTTPSIRLSAEYQFTPLFGLQLEYGKSLDEFIENIDDRYRSQNCNLLHADFRLYPEIVDEYDEVVFYAIDFFAKKHHYLSEWRFDDGGSAVDQARDWYKVTREVQAITLLIGIQTESYGRLFFEAYAGAGVRFKQISNSAPDGWLQYCGPDGICYGDNLTTMRNQNKNSTTLNVMAGIKIGYFINHN